MENPLNLSLHEGFKTRPFNMYTFSHWNVSGPSKFTGKRSKRKKDSEMEAEAQEDEKSSSSNKKKMRTTFTGKQIFELEKSFETKKYLSSAERAEMATSLQVTQQQVNIKVLSLHWNIDRDYIRSKFGSKTAERNGRRRRTFPTRRRPVLWSPSWEQLNGKNDKLRWVPFTVGFHGNILFYNQGNFPVEEDKQLEYYDEICDEISKTGNETNFTSERHSEPEEEQILIVDENISDEEIYETSEDWMFCYLNYFIFTYLAINLLFAFDRNGSYPCWVLASGDN